jgi:hypothetical protein
VGFYRIHCKENPIYVFLQFSIFTFMCLWSVHIFPAAE